MKLSVCKLALVIPSKTDTPFAGSRLSFNAFSFASLNRHGVWEGALAPVRAGAATAWSLWTPRPPRDEPRRAENSARPPRAEGLPGPPRGLRSPGGGAEDGGAAGRRRRSRRGPGARGLYVCLFVCLHSLPDIASSLSVLRF